MRLWLRARGWAAAQGSDVLESLHTPGFRLRWPRLRLAGLLTREFTIAEAAVLLMASFFTSAMLGAVRQVLFNVQFRAGDTASAPAPEKLVD